MRIPNFKDQELIRFLTQFQNDIDQKLNDKLSKITANHSLLLQASDGTVIEVTADYFQTLNSSMQTLDLFVQNGAYSEGSYTPVLSASGGTVPTFTDIPLTGRWIKMGRLITVAVRASNTAGGVPGAGANQLSVSLPFPISSASLGGRRAAGSFNNGTTDGVVFIEIAAGVTTVPLLQHNVVGSKVNQIPLNCIDFNNVARSVSFFFSHLVD